MSKTPFDPALLPRELSVSQTAALVGVNRTRVYQRIDGLPKGAAGRSIETIIRKTGRPGTRRGRQLLIPRRAAVEWYEERYASGQPVGSIDLALAAGARGRIK